MAEVRLTLEEYEALVSRGMAPSKRSFPQGQNPFVKQPKKRKGKKDPKMSKALEKANSMGRKKSGGFKKGWSQGKIMSKAHQLRKRM